MLIIKRKYSPPRLSVNDKIWKLNSSFMEQKTVFMPYYTKSWPSTKFPLHQTINAIVGFNISIPGPLPSFAHNNLSQEKICKQFQGNLLTVRKIDIYLNLSKKGRNSVHRPVSASHRSVKNRRWSTLISI